MNIFKKKQQDNEGLNIIIVGCGKVGSTLVSRLCEEGHNITVIDKNKDVVHILLLQLLIRMSLISSVVQWQKK